MPVLALAMTSETSAEESVSKQRKTEDIGGKENINFYWNISRILHFSTYLFDLHHQLHPVTQRHIFKCCC